MAGFDEVLHSALGEIGTLATGELAGYKDQLLEDARDFAARKKDDLVRWSELLADGKIDADEYRMLLLGARNLLQLRAETYAGIAKTRLDRLRTQIIDILFKAATGLVL